MGQGWGGQEGILQGEPPFHGGRVLWVEAVRACRGGVAELDDMLYGGAASMAYRWGGDARNTLAESPCLDDNPPRQIAIQVRKKSKKCRRTSSGTLSLINERCDRGGGGRRCRNLHSEEPPQRFLVHSASIGHTPMQVPPPCPRCCQQADCIAHLQQRSW